MKIVRLLEKRRFDKAIKLLHEKLGAGGKSRLRGLLGDGHPHLRDWLRRIHARPAYERAVARGGPLQGMG